MGAGSATITASQAGNANYNAATQATQNLTVNKNTATITLSGLSQFYDGTAKQATATTSPAGLSGVNFTYNGLNTAPAIAGTYAAIASLTNPNYTATAATGNLVIGKAGQTIAFNALVPETYGDAPFSLTATGGASGNAISYSSSNTSVATIMGSTVTIVVAGSTTITGSQVGNANYNAATDVINVLTVNKIPLTVTATDQTKIYDGVAFTGGNGVMYTGFINSDNAANNLSGTLTYSGSSQGAKNSGTFAIIPSGYSSANYSINYVNGSVVISKATLVIAANDVSKVQNTLNPELTASYNGFINGETSTVLSVPPTLSTTAVKESVPGNYPISVSGATAVNYAISYTNGVLKVTPGLPLSIEFAGLTVYENQPVSTRAGILTSTSNNAEDIFTYSLVSGNDDNNLFIISGNEIKTAANLDYEQKSSYAIRVRSTNQYDLFFDRELTILINDVNESPTVNDLTNQQICYSTQPQYVNLSGVTAGQDAGQLPALSVSTTNNALFETLQVSQAINGSAQLKYKINNNSFGSAVVSVMVTDDGGTANGGVNTIVKSFNIQVNALPEVTVSSSKGLVLSKGDITELSATGNGTFQWVNAAGIISGQNTSKLTVRPAATTTYKVMVTNPGKCTTEQEITIEVNVDYATINGTNILSPNGDGVNDKLIIKNLDMYPENTIKIYDRAGRLLYSQKNYRDQWDGTINGSALAEDTYYYILDFGPTLGPIKGFISLIHE